MSHLIFQGILVEPNISLFLNISLFNFGYGCVIEPIGFALSFNSKSNGSVL